MAARHRVDADAGSRRRASSRPAIVDAARPVGRCRLRCIWRCSTKPPATSRVVSLECPRRHVSRRSARCIRRRSGWSARSSDLYGLEPVGAPDARPWLDHGRWGVQHPLGARTPIVRHAPAYTFLPAEGEGLHQIPVGPVHAGIIEPGHFRFTANGETVVRLEERLGYVHKGIESLMAGATIERGGAARRRASRATAPSPMRSPSRRPSRPRLTSRCRRARSGCGR